MISSFKINDLNYNLTNKTWVYHPTKTSELCLDEFLNESGLKKISNLDLDINKKDLQEKLTKQKLELFFDPVKWNKKYASLTKILELRYCKDHQNQLKEQRNNQFNNLKKILPQDLKSSITDGYFIKFKGLRDFAK